MVKLWGFGSTGVSLPMELLSFNVPSNPDHSVILWSVISCRTLVLYGGRKVCVVRSDWALVAQPIPWCWTKSCKCYREMGRASSVHHENQMKQPHQMRVVIWNFPNLTSVPPADFGSRSWRCRLLLSSLQVFNVGFWVLRACSSDTMGASAWRCKGSVSRMVSVPTFLLAAATFRQRWHWSQASKSLTMAFLSVTRCSVGFMSPLWMCTNPSPCWQRVLSTGRAVSKGCNFISSSSTCCGVGCKWWHEIIKA